MLDNAGDKQAQLEEEGRAFKVFTWMAIATRTGRDALTTYALCSMH